MIIFRLRNQWTTKEMLQVEEAVAVVLEEEM